MGHGRRHRWGIGALALVLALGLLLAPVDAGRRKRIRRQLSAQPEAFFECILGWKRVRNLRITNPLSKSRRREAIKVARREGGRYPEGTIIQLVPIEAMVKRARGFSPETNDWEFFRLGVDPTTREPFVVQRGTTEVGREDFPTCASCHGKAAAEFDFVCERTHGCDPSFFPPETDFDALAGLLDPRCKDLLAADAE